MTVDGPRVRDFTTSSDDIPVEVYASTVSEMLLSLFVFSGESAERGCDDFECGSIFLERFDDAATPELSAALAHYAGCGVLWLSLLGYAHETASDGDVATFLDRLSTIDPQELRMLVMRNSGVNERHGVSADDLQAAAAGDEDVIQKIIDEEHSELRALLSQDPVVSRDQLVDVIRQYHAEVFSTGDDVTAALQRDAVDKRILAKSVRAEELVEMATGGVTFRMQPSVNRILLVPSVVIRPWAVIAEHGTTRIFCYSVDDQHLIDDPDAPPARLVDLYKALGDDRRLRLLTILAEGDEDLKTLSERIDLGKSTTHHHLRILRSAGLVRILVSDDDKKYSLRKEGIAEAGPLLEQFVITRSRI